MEQEEKLDDETTFAKEALQCEIGQKLQQAREEQQISIEHIVKELKFSKTFLQALESGNWQAMPGEVYALGFLKQYADLLGVDVSTEVERIKSKSFELNIPLTYPDETISPNRKWVAIAIVLFIALIIMMNISSSDNESNHTTNIKLPLQKESSNQQLIQSSQQAIQHLPQAVEQSAPEENITPAFAKAQSISTKQEDNDASTAPRDAKTYSFYAAKNDVWLQVYEQVDGAEPKLLREVLLKHGQSFSIINTTSQLLLTAGNARALEVLIDGDVVYAVDTLGEQDKVLKQFPLNP